MKKLKVLVTALILSFAVALGGMTLVFAEPALAAEGEPTRVMPSISVNNGEFSSTSGSSALSDASDWTGAFASSSEDKGVYRGVVDTSKYDFLKEAGFKDETTVKTLQDAALTHKTKNPNDVNTNALLIHNSVESVYQYTSSEFTVPANGYLTVSVDVFTGNFAPGQTAYVGFSAKELKDLAFEVSTDNAWTTLTFAIRGYRYRTITSKLVLSVGVSTDFDDVKTVKGAQGYAFFDSVKLLLQRPEDFDLFYKDIIGSATEGVVIKGNTQILLTKENDAQPIQDASFSLDLSQAADKEYWQTKESSTQTKVFTGVSSGLTAFTNKDDGKALADPYAPFSLDGKILSMQSNDGGAATVEAGDKNLFTLPRFGYARVSVWVNMVNAKKDTAVSITLATDDDYAEKSGSVTSVTAQNENSWTEGWGEAVFLVKGSSFDARKLRLSMGVTGLNGAVSFDNVSYEILTGEAYSALTGGTTIEMDATTDTVTNGSFNAFDVMGKDKLLAPAKNWTLEASDHAAVGVAPIDDEYFASAAFETTRNKLGLGPTEKPVAFNGKTNALLMRNAEEGYASVKSESISAPADAADSSGNTTKSPYNLIKVQIASWLVPNNYASIELYANDVKVAQFSKINTANNKNFVTYTFSVKIDTASAPTYSVKLIAGTKDTPVTGSVWVNNVWIGNSAAGEPASDSVKTVALDTTMFDAVAGDAPYYNNLVWEKVTDYDSPAAILNFVQAKNYNGDSYSARLKEMLKGATSDYAMYLNSDTPISAGLRHSFDVKFTESTFVKVTARIKTRGFAADQGARFMLGTHEIKKINTQVIRENELDESLVFSPDYVNGEYFGWRDYTFYVNVGSTAGQTAKISIWLGDGKSISNRRTGSVLVDSVKISSITETEYDEATAIFDEYDADDEANLPTNALRVVLSETKEENGGSSPNPDVSTGGIDPWIIPSVLFGVAVLIAIIGVGVKKFMARPRKAVAHRGTVSYDRNNRIIVPKRDVTLDKTEDVEDSEDESGEYDYDAPLVHTPFAEEVTEEDETDANAETTAEAAEPAEVVEATIETPGEESATEDESSAQSESEAPAEKVETPKPAKKKPTVKEFDSFDD